jgi:GT2 family glycosyltransferase
MTETIYILLPVHNRREVTRCFVASLKAQTYCHFHLILIDDGSTDGTDEMVREQICNLTIIKGRGDWWWAGALQQGYNWLKSKHPASNDIALIINDDTDFSSEFLGTAVQILAKHDSTLLLAQGFSRRDGRLLDSGVNVDWRKFWIENASSPELVNCLSTRGLFLRVSDFFRIGGFHPRLLPHYTSDYEFTMRANRKGMKLITDRSLRLWVDEEMTGCLHIDEMPFLLALKTLFAKKTAINPVTMTWFVVLSCPRRWIAINIIRIWLDALKKMVISFQNDNSKKPSM